MLDEQGASSDSRSLIELIEPNGLLFPAPAEEPAPRVGRSARGMLLHAASGGELEQAMAIPILDIISVVVRKSLRLAGANPRLVRGWGRLFRELDR